MSVIVPAIIPTSKEDLEDKLARLAGIASDVQIDVVDGRFVGPASWPYAGMGAQELAAMAANEEMLPHWGQVSFDIDLMALDPEETLGAWVELGANRITIHTESTGALARLVGDFGVRFGHAKGFAPGLISLGLAVGLDTDPAILEPFIEDIDYVQFMGIKKIGGQGQPFDDRAVRRVAALRRRHPEILIQVDGGVSRASAPALLSAGADRLVVGSALWKAPDLAAEYAALVDIAEQYGS
jgi:ribulose-phosphate 3-epimerase